MSDNECNHWHHNTDSDTVYCNDCLEILSVEPYWWGTIAIGLMENNFERNGCNLDLGDLIAEFLGLNRVNLSTVKIVTDKNESWKQTHYISFTVGSQPMEADIHAVRSDHYIPTGLKFEVPEEIPGADALHA